MAAASQIAQAEHQTMQRRTRQGGYVLYILFAGVGLGWLMIVVFALSTSNSLGVIGVGSIVASASSLIGAFVGFIFGVPRSLQGESSETAAVSGQHMGTSVPFRPNTSLEQISDWLTKILVGAGLTQIVALASWIRELGRSLAPSFGGGSNAEAFAASFAASTVLYFFFAGFFIAFLWTRLYLAELMVQADMRSLESQFAEVKERCETLADQISKQAEFDAKALSLAALQMNPSSGAGPAQSDLNDLIQRASDSVKAQVFYKAEELRRNTWSSNKPLMERAIPIFRALISCEPPRFFRNHGEIGLAFKDQVSPNWEQAAGELTTAIELRDSKNVPAREYPFYEFARALCMIEMELVSGRRTSPNMRERIARDLDLAGKVDYVARIIESHPRIQEWSRLNGLQNQ